MSPDLERRRFALSGERLLQDWREAHRRAHAYLDALAVPEAERVALVDEAVARAVDGAWGPTADAVGETQRSLRALLVERDGGAGGDDAYVEWRLARAAAPRAAIPPLARTAMVPERIERRLARRLFRREARTPGERQGRGVRRSRRKRQGWIGAARRRRLALVGLVLVPTVIASMFMSNVLPRGGETLLELPIVVVFGVLFGWVSIGFWTALFGFGVLLTGRDRFAISRLAPGSTAGAEPAPGVDARPRSDGVTTAIVMPICEEPVERVFAGLRAIQRSLDRTGQARRFHLYVLSDTLDPSTAAREEEAWLDWCREEGVQGRAFYRRRKVRIARKSGNVADFCRRWGARYEHMIVLDADSIMSGATLVRLADLMEAHPQVGMIQTAPKAVNRQSPLARAQQFSARLYGPMFAAGLSFWQLGDGQYWGHNTIIRVAPFIAHCGLPRLPGRAPLGGEILSHDFVEAALMARSGWTVWLAYDLDGTYEEVPSTLLEEMNRDRRWCQGNLQHLKLLFTEGLFGAHRMLFLNGALSYVSALLWFLFLVLSTVEAILRAVRPPDYFPAGRSLFPEWPVWHWDWALALMAVTAVLLFLPKVLAVLLVGVGRGGGGGPRRWGGLLRVMASVGLEVLLSTLLAPIRMVFHSRFVLTNLLGHTVTWRSQGREDAATGWREAIRQHGFDSIFASAWGGVLYWLNPGYFWWVTPIVGALLLSIPLSVLSSRAALGGRLRRWGLFQIPEERDPPTELRDLDRGLEQARACVASKPVPERDGFVRMAVDPALNALRRKMAGSVRHRVVAEEQRRASLVERALGEGPAALDARARRLLMTDPVSIEALHIGVWSIPSRALAARWGRPGAEGAP